MYYVALYFFVSCFNQGRSGLSIGSWDNVDSNRVDAIFKREVALVNFAREVPLINPQKVGLTNKMKYRTEDLSKMFSISDLDSRSTHC